MLPQNESPQELNNNHYHSTPELPDELSSVATAETPSLVLDETEQEQLRQLGRFAQLLGLQHEQDWVPLVGTHPIRLSRSLDAALHRLRVGNPAAALLVHEVPLDSPLVGTPSAKAQARASLAAVPVAKAGLAGISEAVGPMVAYRQEKVVGAGGLFMPVHPIRGAESTQTANSSEVDLTYHTELAFHPYSPTHLGLLCLRPDHERRAATYFAIAKEIQNQLSAETREILRQRVFTTQQDESWGGGPVAGLMAVLRGSEDDPELTYDLDLMRSPLPEATRALAELGEAALAVRRQVVLQEGDLLLLDNRRAVHGRSPFTARYDGSDRWLLRSYVATSLRPSAADRPGGGRLIATSFSKAAAA